MKLFLVILVIHVIRLSDCTLVATEKYLNLHLHHITLITTVRKTFVSLHCEQGVVEVQNRGSTNRSVQGSVASK